MRIVTYNVNGLRPRVAQHGSLLRLLNSLEADVICFQETKLSRQELSADITMADGYEAFFSCTRTSSKGRVAYSGVATFCRVNSAFASQEVTLPIAAEEGITGVLDSSANNEKSRNFLLMDCITADGVPGLTMEEVSRVDGEGRCVITDHGHFILFNIYGPRAEDDDEERVRFKLIFYKILQKRWDCLVANGRRVIVVGDLNIAPAAIDRCDAGPGFEKHKFREWLRSMLMDQGGPFFDAFRSKHPDREGAYTCFSQRIGAEEYNYGSRIDHVLISGTCFHQDHNLHGHSFFDCHVKECDIMTWFKRGSDTSSKWKGGRTIKLEGSDHIPVYVTLSEMPELPVHSTPSLAVRYIPEVRGRQQTIVAFLCKEKKWKTCGLSSSSRLGDMCSQSCLSCFGQSQGCEMGVKQHHSEIGATHSGNKHHMHTNSNQHIDQTQEHNSVIHGVLRLESIESSVRHEKAASNKRPKPCGSQLTIKSFLTVPNVTDAADSVGGCAAGLDSSGDIKKGSDETLHQNAVENNETIISESSTKCDKDQEEILSASIKSEKTISAVMEWQSIQQKMKMTLPRCRGHHEPCVPRSVKKGSNVGRLFYVCARAQGPASNPEANCGHFQWATAKSKEKRR